jgi:SPP1 family predicted phage head-tail adaptor
MARIRSGQLRRLVTIQTSTPTIDADGESIASWSRWMRNVPAKIETQGGGETRRGEGIEAGISHTVTIRHLDDVSPKMRLKTDDGRLLNIDRVTDPDGYRRELVLICREVDDK